MSRLLALLCIALARLMVALIPAAASAASDDVTPPLAVDQAPQCPGYTVCPKVLAQTAMTTANALTILHTLERAEATFIRGLKDFSSISQAAQTARLGLIIISDLNLSVRRNQACFSCHTSWMGFTGGISLINNTTVAAFGSQGVPLIDGKPTRGDRAGFRRAITYAYTPFAPKLRLDRSNELVGGMFWDMRASGFVSGDPAVDQAMGPFINPVEMAFPDPACVVRRIAQSQYASEFALRWGDNSFDIAWPPDTDTLCARPNSSNDPTPEVLALKSSRAQATQTYLNIATSVAAIERGTGTSRFKSRYDNALCGTVTLSPIEQRGMTLFFGRGKCVKCHVSIEPSPPATCGATLDALFTNFKASNIGVPQNPDIPFLTENAVDDFGYIANPAGPSFIDRGVGDFLRTLTGNPNRTLAKFATLAPQYDGKFQIPTLRLVTRQRSGVSRSYGHNGVFPSIESVVHFHNTRDVLGVCPRAGAKQPGFGVTCWPAPEVATNLETGLVGNLGLSDREENDLIAFLDTLKE
jgi:cytochrome c peroxidase